MTKEQCLAIENLSKKEAATIKRYFWEAEKKGKECKLEACKTPEEVIAKVNASFKKSETVKPKTFSLADFSIEELEEMMNQIPQIIEQKKSEKANEILEQIKVLQDQIKELKKTKDELFEN